MPGIEREKASSGPGAPEVQPIMEEQNETFALWGHRFHGAYSIPAALASMPGAYVIWCEKWTGWKVLDVRESEDVREQVVDHGRAVCWRRRCHGFVGYCALYTSGEPDRALFHL